MILQGIFAPSAKIEDVKNFVKEHLHNPEKPFVICKCSKQSILNVQKINMKEYFYFQLPLP